MKHILQTTLTIIFMTALLTASLPVKTSAASAGHPGTLFAGNPVTSLTCANTCTINDVAVNEVGETIAVGRIDSGGGGAAFDFLVLKVSGSVLEIATFDISGTIDSANAVIFDDSGKIVVAGNAATVGGQPDFAVIRLNNDLTLDPTFDGDGKVITDFSGAGSDIPRALLPSGFGKIVVGGSVTVGGNRDFGLVKYNNNGSLDTTFSGDGKFNFDVGNATNELFGLRQGNIGICVAGVTNQDFVTALVAFNGALDTTFDGDGIAVTDVNGNDTARTCDFQSDNRIVVGGISNGNSSIVRFNTNGSLDTTFDGDGKVVYDFVPGNTDNVIDLQIFDSLIYLAIGGVTNGHLTGRLKSNGSPDFTYGAVNGTINNKFSVLTGVSISAIALDNISHLYGVGSNGTDKLEIFNLGLAPTPSQKNDFDGDGFPDYVIFRPAAASWFILRSSDNTVQIEGFGANGDIPLDGDFDGDGKADLAIYRPSLGQWWFQRSSNNTTHAAQFGTAADKPVPGDADKDGKTDFVFWRPSNGNYFVLRSSDNFSSFFGFQFGQNGDVPVGSAVFP